LGNGTKAATILNMRTIHSLSTSVVLLSLFACADDAEEQTKEENLSVDVKDTAVKEQTIGNCWLYATAAWAESLHLTASKQSVDLSEAYWTFWHWHDQITSGDLTDGRIPGEPITEGGFWGVAIELMSRYGFSYENDFKPSKVNAKVWQAEALAEIQTSLSSGPLATESARQDPERVFDELARAWKLSASVAADLKTAFVKRGADLRTGAKLDGTVARPLTQLKAPNHDGRRVITMKDIVGTQEPNSAVDEGRRVGPEAWSEVNYRFKEETAEGAKLKRDIIRNVQDTLNKKLGVPVGWLVGAPRDGVFSGSQDAFVGAHESVLVDYEAVLSGDKLLRIGQNAQPSQLEAALAPAVKVTRFRIKNSWGTNSLISKEEWEQMGGTGEPPTNLRGTYLPERPGYNDIDADYFNTYAPSYGVRFLLVVALPNTQRFPTPRLGLKRTFVTREAFQATALKDRGDAVCQAAAAKAGLEGKYGAYMSKGAGLMAQKFPLATSSYRGMYKVSGKLHAHAIEAEEHPMVDESTALNKGAVWDGWDGNTCTSAATARTADGQFESAQCTDSHAVKCMQF
jgi:hypothetical protein